MKAHTAGGVCPYDSMHFSSVGCLDLFEHHIIKTVGNGNTAPHILNFSITQKHEAIFTPQQLQPREKYRITCL